MEKKICLLPGDGIGPEILAEGVRVLRAAAEKGGHSFIFEEALIGGAAIDATGSPLPAETVVLSTVILLAVTLRSPVRVELRMLSSPSFVTSAVPLTLLTARFSTTLSQVMRLTLTLSMAAGGGVPTLPSLRHAKTNI